MRSSSRHINCSISAVELLTASSAAWYNPSHRDVMELLNSINWALSNLFSFRTTEFCTGDAAIHKHRTFSSYFSGTAHAKVSISLRSSNQHHSSFTDYVYDICNITRRGRAHYEWEPPPYKPTWHSCKDGYLDPAFLLKQRALWQTAQAWER